MRGPHQAKKKNNVSTFFLKYLETSFPRIIQENKSDAAPSNDAGKVQFSKKIQFL